MGCRTFAGVLVLIVALAATLAAGASGAGPRVGLEGGLNLAELTFKADEAILAPEPAFRGAWWLGLPVELPFAERWALVCGPRYVEYGEIVEVTISGTGIPSFGFTVHTTLEYLSVPLRVQARPFPSRRIFLSLGPELGYLVGARETNTLTGGAGFMPAPAPARPTRVEAQIFENLSSANLRDRYYPWNLSAGAGAGWEAPLLGHTAQLHARFTQGLTDFVRNDAIRRTTRGIEIGAGLLW